MATVFATVATPGPPGPAGPAGPAGVSPVWIVAAGVPANTTGSNSDMYLNNLTGDVYGPKSGGAWGAIAANIKGSPGTPGYSPQYIVQPGPPSPAVGATGDMYINSTTSDLYGPKTGGAWGPVVANLRGGTGPSGATGPQGPPGVGYTPRGVWVSTTGYGQGDQVSYNNQLYISLQSGNVGNIPVSSPTWWEAVTTGGAQTPWLSNIDGGAFTLNNAGRIGIGTPVITTPYSRLHVRAAASGALFAGGSGATVIFAENDFGGCYVETSTPANGSTGYVMSRGASLTAYVVDSANGTGLNINCNASQPLVFTLGNAERMRITSAGLVGIGASVPGALLDVQRVATGQTINALSTATIGTNYGLVAQAMGSGATNNVGVGASASGGTNNYGVQILGPIAGANNYAIYSAAPAQVYIAGNVGIGTTNPTAQLHISTAGATAIELDQTGAGSSVNYAIVAQVVGSTSVNTALYVNVANAANNYGIRIVSPSASANNWAIYSDATAHSYFAGYVGIGVTNALRELQVRGGANITLCIGGGPTVPNSASIEALNDATTANVALEIRSTATCFTVGNVGVGTANPGSEAANARLAIAGNPGQTASSLATSNTQAVFSARGNSSSGYSLAIGSESSGSWPYIQGVNFNGGAASASLLLNAWGGNVGIAKTNPAYPLDVTGDINTTGVFRVNGTPISPGGGLTTMSVVTGSRAFGTNYQNGAQPRWVSVNASLNGTSSMVGVSDAAANPTTTVAIVNNVGAGVAGFSVGFWVMPSQYYRVQMTAGSATVTFWIEYT